MIEVGFCGEGGEGTTKWILFLEDYRVVVVKTEIEINLFLMNKALPYSKP